jgi:hypothetical protein
MSIVVFERYHLAPCGINCGTCSSCGSALSVHEAKCGNCEKEYGDSQFLEMIS